MKPDLLIFYIGDGYMRRLFNILSIRLLAAILAWMFLCMPTLGWSGSSATTPQASSIRIDNVTSSSWFDKGLELYAQEKYEQAIQAWDEAIKINPQYAIAWNAKGNALWHLGKYNEAINAYDQAISIESKYADAWSIKAQRSLTWVNMMKL